MAARRDRSKHDGGVLILIQEHILFEEIDTGTIWIAERAESVAIVSHSLLFVCCYRLDVLTWITFWIHMLQCHRLFVEILMSMNLPGCISTTLQALAQQHWIFANPEVYINGSTFQFGLMPFWIQCYQKILAQLKHFQISTPLIMLLFC